MAILIPRSSPRRFRQTISILLLGCALALGAGCDEQKIIPPPPVDPVEIVGWRPLGTWTGVASVFTETITSDSASFRVHWQATSLKPSGDTGTLSVIFRSGDSGNPIINAVNTDKPGSGTVNVGAERPRWYYLDIQSSDVKWQVTVEEPIYGSR